MRRTILLVAIFGAFLQAPVCALAAVSEAPVPSVTVSDSDSALSEDKSDGPPAWTFPSVDFQPWFNECQKRIDKVLRKNHHSSQITDDTRCAFFIKPNGKLDDYFVYNMKARSNDADAIALKIVRKAAPFKNPPAPILQERRLLVSFSRESGQLNSKLEWDRFDYTFVKPEDRLKDFPLKKPRSARH